MINLTLSVIISTLILAPCELHGISLAPVGIGSWLVVWAILTGFVWGCLTLISWGFWAVVKGWRG